MQSRTLLPIDILKKLVIVSVSLILLLALASCQQEEGIEQEEFGMTEEVDRPATEMEVYRADLSEVNNDMTEEEVSGTAMVQVSTDSVTFMVDASGLPPGTMHMIHFHGFADGRGARCPGSDADVNNDEIVDVNEAHQVAGVPLLPLNENPAEANIMSQTYPIADQQGNLRYRKTVALEEISNMMQEQYNIAAPDWGNFAVNIHGIRDTVLPQSVQSMDGVPTHLTVPIACGALERAEGGERVQMNGQMPRRPNGQMNEQEQHQTTPQPDEQ